MDRIVENQVFNATRVICLSSRTPLPLAGAARLAKWAGQVPTPLRIVGGGAMGGVCLSISPGLWLPDLTALAQVYRGERTQVGGGSQ